MLIGGLGPARLNTGEDVTGHLHSPALHSRHEHILRPVPLEPQSADHRTDDIQTTAYTPLSHNKSAPVWGSLFSGYKARSQIGTSCAGGGRSPIIKRARPPSASEDMRGKASFTPITARVLADPVSGGSGLRLRPRRQVMTAKPITTNPMDRWSPLIKPGFESWRCCAVPEWQSAS